MLSDRSAAASPFGDEITFPVDPNSLNYYHPDKH
jgi:succinate dehydrogenase / fumarate reductase iron-sulfur subunit